MSDACLVMSGAYLVVFLFVPFISFVPFVSVFPFFFFVPCVPFVHFKSFENSITGSDMPSALGLFWLDYGFSYLSLRLTIQKKVGNVFWMMVFSLWPSKGLLSLPYSMNFRKTSKRPLTPPKVRKSKNFPDSKIYTTKTFQIKCVNRDIDDFATNACKPKIWHRGKTA